MFGNVPADEILMSHFTMFVKKEVARRIKDTFKAF